MTTSAVDREKNRRARRDQLTPERVARNWLTFYEDEYHETRNPVCAWDAIAEALAHNLELPPWVRGYLLESAGRMTRLSRDKTPRKGTIAPAVAAALGFSPRRNPFKMIEQQEHELMMAFHVYETHVRNRKNKQAGIEGPHDWNTVFRDAAVWHQGRCDRKLCRPSAKTMERYWYKHALTVIPPHLIDRAQSRKIDHILAIE